MTAGQMAPPTAGLTAVESERTTAGTTVVRWAVPSAAWMGMTTADRSAVAWVDQWVGPTVGWSGCGMAGLWAALTVLSRVAW
jgi:hypothetical protein